MENDGDDGADDDLLLLLLAVLRQPEYEGADPLLHRGEQVHRHPQQRSNLPASVLCTLKSIITTFDFSS